MRQHSFASRLKSLAFVFGIAMAFASCANEDVAQNPTEPNENNDKNLTTFIAGDEAKTRTSMDYNSGDFYWEDGDYIYVKDDDGTWQKSTNAPTSKVAAFKYKVPGKFTASTSYKVYYLGKNSSGNDVTISATQTQTTPDNTEHFGTSGDYGSATANKIIGKQQFSFTLEHQPAYLVFQPYTSNTILNKCYLTKVEVTSDNDIAETYTINTSTDNLDASAGSKQIVLTTKSTSGAYTNGFPLTNSSASRTTNGAYMIIKPGSHILRVRYWVKDIVTNVEGTITKLLPSTAYASNTYYDVTANLDTRAYDGNHYYLWDAKEQYWKGYEWTKHLAAGVGQPTINFGLSGATISSNYPQNNADPNNRWAHEGGGAFQATQSCDTLPNVNEMTWYAANGNPCWDADELWTTMGHLYKGGIWLKKKANISGFNANTAVDGTDWRTNVKTRSWPVSNTLPSAADAGNYFYLPASGYYHTGGLYGVDQSGDYSQYWSSSACIQSSSHAYQLIFNGSIVNVCYNYRYDGYRVGWFK